MFQLAEEMVKKMRDLGLNLAEDDDKEDLEELGALIMLRLVDQSISDQRITEL